MGAAIRPSPGRTLPRWQPGCPHRILGRVWYVGRARVDCFGCCVLRWLCLRPITVRSWQRDRNSTDKVVSNRVVSVAATRRSHRLLCRIFRPAPTVRICAGRQCCVAGTCERSVTACTLSGRAWAPLRPRTNWTESVRIRARRRGSRAAASGRSDRGSFVSFERLGYVDTVGRPGDTATDNDPREKWFAWPRTDGG